MNAWSSLLTYKGITCSLTEWSEITGLKIHILSGRKRRGWEPDRIFETPVRKYQKIDEQVAIAAEIERRYQEERKQYNADMESQTEEVVASD